MAGRIRAGARCRSGRPDKVCCCSGAHPPRSPPRGQCPLLRFHKYGSKHPHRPDRSNRVRGATARSRWASSRQRPSSWLGCQSSTCGDIGTPYYRHRSRGRYGEIGITGIIVAIDRFAARQRRIQLEHRFRERAGHRHNSESKWCSRNLLECEHGHVTCRIRREVPYHTGQWQATWSCPRLTRRNDADLHGVAKTVPPEGSEASLIVRGKRRSMCTCRITD